MGLIHQYHLKGYPTLPLYLRVKHTFTPTYFKYNYWSCYMVHAYLHNFTVVPYADALPYLLLHASGLMVVKPNTPSSGNTQASQHRNHFSRSVEQMRKRLNNSAKFSVVVRHLTFKAVLIRLMTQFLRNSIILVIESRIKLSPEACRQSDYR